MFLITLPCCIAAQLLPCLLIPDHKRCARAKSRHGPKGRDIAWVEEVIRLANTETVLDDSTQRWLHQQASAECSTNRKAVRFIPETFQMSLGTFGSF